MTSRVAIVNCGGANIASLVFALERLAVGATLTADAGEIREASHVILPGVGAAADAMQRLHEMKLANVIPMLRQPVLGICLGMQLLGESSEEDEAKCLGVFPVRATKLAVGVSTPVPHMGWSTIRSQRQHPLLEGIADSSWFYFVHSYALPVTEHCMSTATHGMEFCAIAGKDNFYATQFHPERSAADGARLLQNFLALSI